MNNNQLKRNSGKIAIYAVLVVGGIVMIFPFLWMILTSLKTMTEATRVPPTFFPSAPVWGNYPKAMQTLPFDKLFLNTVAMMGLRIFFALGFSSMAGYAFAKIRFPGKNLLFGIVLVQLMLPTQVFLLPQYAMVAKMGWLNTIWALVFPGIVSAFGVFFLRQFYMGLPDELAEAAYLDGCNQWQIFAKIMFPLTKTAMMALAIFTAIFAWSDLMWPLIVNMSIDKMTLAAGIASIKGQHFTNYPVVMAASFVAMLPMLLLYLLFQKQFVEGIALTGTKA